MRKRRSTSLHLSLTPKLSVLPPSFGPQRVSPCHHHRGARTACSPPRPGSAALVAACQVAGGAPKLRPSQAAAAQVAAPRVSGNPIRNVRRGTNRAQVRPVHRSIAAISGNYVLFHCFLLAIWRINCLSLLCFARRIT